MTYDYTLNYKVGAALAALGRELIGGTILPYFNTLDLRNYGDWLNLNFHFLPFGIALIAIMSIAVIRAIITKNVRLALFAFCFFAIYIPTSGLVFKHRNFYSVRYFEPILLLGIIGFFILLQNRIETKNRWYLLIGMLFYFIINWHIFAPYYNIPLIVTERAYLIYPTNPALQTFYLQDLERINRWGRLSNDQVSTKNHLFQNLFSNCVTSADFKDYPNKHLCKDFIEYLRYINYEKVDSSRLMNLHTLFEGSKKENNSAFFKDIFGLIRTKIDPSVGLRQDLPQYYSSEKGRLNYWKDLCLKSSRRLAIDFFQSQKQLGLLDDIGLKVALAESDFTNNTDKDLQKLKNCRPE
jgi:hypothetical protein